MEISDYSRLLYGRIGTPLNYSFKIFKGATHFRNAIVLPDRLLPG
jgi:hypothetical protein